MKEHERQFQHETFLIRKLTRAIIKHKTINYETQIIQLIKQHD